MNPTATRRAFVEQVMGIPMSVHVIASDPSAPQIESAVQQLFADLRRADAVCSPWRVDSDLMRWRAGQLRWQQVDPWLREVREVADEAVEVTGGLFTLDLVGPDGSRGWDPTGVVKGWAADRAARRLTEVPGISFSVNAGGDILCRGTQTWRIGIQDPRDPEQVQHVVEVTNGAVATSGTAQRGGHILDPRSGQPVTRQGSVTVTGPELTWADIWATVCFIDPSVTPDHGCRVEHLAA